MPEEIRPLPLVHRLAPRLYYGWFVALAGSVLAFLVIGIGFYGQVVLLDAFVGKRGFDREAVSALTAAYWIAAGLFGFAIGRSIDRYGVRLFMAAGVVCMSVAFLWIGRVASLEQAVPAYLLLALGLALAGAVPNGAVITRWFIARRSAAMTLSHTGVSFGGILAAPLLAHWIEADGIRASLDRLALLLVAVGLPLVFFVLRETPEQHGLAPDAAAEQPLPAALRRAQYRHWSRRAVLKTPVFYLLAAAYSLMLLCQVGYSMHQFSFLRERLDLETASLAVACVAFGSMLARLVFGPLADRVSKTRLAACLFVFQALMVVCLAQAESAPALIAASIGFGCTVGAIFMLQALLVGELFGMVSFGTVMGLQQMLSQTASGFGPLILGVLAAGYGGYAPALYWLAVGALFAAVLVSRIRPPALSPGADERPA